LHAHLLLRVADQKPKSVEVINLDLVVNLLENFADSVVFDPVIFRVENRLLRPVKHSNIALTMRHSAHHCLEFKRLWKGKIRRLRFARVREVLIQSIERVQYVYVDSGCRLHIIKCGFATR
jgi:hypothetical protein